ncbi:1,4-alpha-glucan branching protein domain-containing protein [Marinicrinis sediminis]|uniref:1,4-alpha-glucan branching protein domain-containing protein n=1 Tax=Marinicrinis sediminis TaxID=1652465 RepID=A0ABW5REE2_9BACL
MGRLNLVLHTHLPYVFHHKDEHAIEERWLFEALTESYLPLLMSLDQLSKENVAFRITMSMTPPLLTMLAMEELHERYQQHLDNLEKLLFHELSKTDASSSLSALRQWYCQRIQDIRYYYEHTLHTDVLQHFRDHWEQGNLELITSSATHAFLPYIQTEESRRVQIAYAVSVHERLLGSKPRGIWLPECGYVPELDHLLCEYGLDFFYTDAHALLHSRPQPPAGLYEPVQTPAGIHVFARDGELCKQVWSATEGYPGESHYREYYRDVGFDASDAEIAPFMHPSGVRLNTGLKYYRITGKTPDKDIYDPQVAACKVSEHAYHFVSMLDRKAETLRTSGSRHGGCMTASFDTELFGHWWFEGVQWIEQVCRHLARNDKLQMTTAVLELKEQPESHVSELHFSSWGRGGYGDVWLGKDNCWIYKELHRMEQQMIEQANACEGPTKWERRILNLMGRELLLAQSSDWAFIIDNQTTVQYAKRRMEQHKERFWHLQRMFAGAAEADEVVLDLYDDEDQFGKGLQYEAFRTRDHHSLRAHSREAHPVSSVSSVRNTILMLSWEFPPLTVGGLSRHVFDLSTELVRQGIDVHVITSGADTWPVYEVMNGIHVHRVSTPRQPDIHFLDWVLQLNIAMVEKAKQCRLGGGPAVLIHAHDWLVSYAARQLKKRMNLPLIATIHATEHGRNQGIFTELQHKISEQEWRLCMEADQVICCSKYMEQEIRRIFSLPGDKLHVIYNGIEVANLQVDMDESSNDWPIAEEDLVILFIGRLVREKGVATLIESAEKVLQREPRAKWIVAGKGPMREQWMHEVRQRQLEAHFWFPGFVDDQTRNRLLLRTQLCVFPSYYEPFGIVALEAMASRIPVIVSQTGGLQEIISHGVDGMTVTPGMADDLAEATLTLLHHPVYRDQLAQAGYEKVLHTYSWQQIARDTMNVYERVWNREPVSGGMSR